MHKTSNLILNYIFKTALVLSVLYIPLNAANNPEVTMIAGDAYINSNSGWEKLTTSSIIKKDSIIKISRNSKITLSLSNLNADISGPSIIKVEDLTSEAGKKESAGNTHFNKIIKRITGSLKSEDRTTVVAVRGEKISSSENPEWAGMNETDAPCLESCSSLVEDKKFAEAINCIAEKRSEKCTGTWHYLHGLILLDKGNFRDAARYFEKARNSRDISASGWEHSLILEALSSHYTGTTLKAAELIEKDLGRLSAYRLDALTLLELFHKSLGNSGRSKQYREIIDKEIRR